jgi:SAM-dependent methyltransferase
VSSGGPAPRPEDPALRAELEYHERLYAGFAQGHFAKPAVVELRRHLANRIARAARLGPSSRVLSIGCGIGDTELLIAPRVAGIVGVDLSPSAVRAANQAALEAGVSNFRAVCAPFPEPSVGSGFDAVIAVFFLHHLGDPALRAIPRQVAALLRGGGTFYSLDPNRRRLSGWIGETFFPKLMERYQSPAERPLDPSTTVALFRDAGLAAESRWYDYVSTPLAGLAPSMRTAYRAARLLDNALVALPVLNRYSSNFEIVATTT